MNFSRYQIVVTGGSSGIGLALAEELSQFPDVHIHLIATDTMKYIDCQMNSIGLKMTLHQIDWLVI